MGINELEIEFTRLLEEEKTLVKSIQDTEQSIRELERNKALANDIQNKINRIADNVAKLKQALEKQNSILKDLEIQKDSLDVTKLSKELESVSSNEQRLRKDIDTNENRISVERKEVERGELIKKRIMEQKNKNSSLKQRLDNTIKRKSEKE